MCAQFRNHNLPNHFHEEHHRGASVPSNALVVQSQEEGRLNADLQQAKQRYGLALESLHQQRVVLEMLEDLIAKTIPATPLLADAMVQTDVSGSAGEMPFKELVLKKLELLQIQRRRANAKVAYANQLRALRSQMMELREAAEDAVPHGVAMVGVGREGRTVLPTSLLE